MIDFEISTYWNVETLYYVFNGVAAIMGGAGFAGLLKMVFLLALIVGIFAYAGNRQLELATWFIQALIFVTLLNLPVARVAITDKTNLEPPRVVDNVPFALAVVAQASTTAFGWAAQTYETVFNVPDAIGLAKGDLAFAHRILKGVNRASIQDPKLRGDLMQFIKECTIYDLKDGAISQDQILSQTDTFNTILNRSNTNPARFVTYDTLTPNPKTVPCTMAADVLKGRVDGGLAAAQRYYGRQAITRADSDAIANGMFLSAVGTSYDWILNSSVSASDAMKQAMFNNLWREAGSELPALMSDPARVQEMQNLMSAAQAARQADGSNSTISMLAQETLPHMRNWLEAMIYACFPIVVVMTVLVSQEGAKKLLGGYMMSIAWIGMWPVMFAVINHLSLMLLQRKARGLKLSEGIPFQLSDVFDATLGNEQTAIAYMVVLVPFISGAIIKMAQGGFMSVADKMFSGFSSVASSAGASMASGNISMGQVGLDTAAVNTTTMHKYNSNMELASGGASIQYGNGSTATIAASGRQAMSVLTNKFAHKVSESMRLQSSNSSETGIGNNVTSGQTVTERAAQTATLTSTVGNTRASGGTQNIQDEARFTQSGTDGGVHSTSEGVFQNKATTKKIENTSIAADSFSAGLRVAQERDKDSGQESNGNGRGAGVSGPDAKRTGNALANGFSASGLPASSAPTEKNKSAPVSKWEKIKGTARGMGPSLSGTTGKTYTASEGRDRATSRGTKQDEDIRTTKGYENTGSGSHSESNGQHYDNTNRASSDASRAKTNEYARTKDVATRSEASIHNRASRSQSHDFEIHRDLTSDPEYLKKVAHRFGMSEARFAGQEEGRQWNMIQNYAAEKGAMKAAGSMPTQTLDGRPLPTSQKDLDSIKSKREAMLSNRVDAIHAGNVKKSGYQGVESLNPDVSVPQVAAANKGFVKDMGNPNVVGSLPERTRDFDQNHRAWVSDDLPVGAGRVSLQDLNASAIKADVTDTVGRVGNMLLGKDEDPIGKPYTPVMKREIPFDVPVNKPSDR